MQTMTVSAFLAYVNETFKAIWDSTEIAIEGEVSGFKISQGQWVSFDLKDADALLNVFLPIWKLQVPVQDGLRVRVFGLPRVYPKYGKFSFSAERIDLAGEGALQKALALTRQKLEQEGLFDPSRKRSLPRFPERIALIASRESAAYGDFIRIVNERWSGLEIDLYHVLVQGERAPEQIARAIQVANTPHPNPLLRKEREHDVLILTRGGGSLEELMAFNDERVVRALYASKIPTLVGIGHERDLTLAEEVADVRGSTPTDCARRLVPDRNEILYELATLQERIADDLQEKLDYWSRQADETVSMVDRWLEMIVLRSSSLERLLRSFDPRAVVKRGYAIVSDADGHPISSIKLLSPGKKMDIQLRDGEVEGVVESVGRKK
ncbi:MAG: exodeoxyribonuclease VII large subunit [Candidatus Uhrbacteria bacterium]|nr:exodeoxyribonuclease VII large subunit [Candidatus Uhrbacteria bacterium]